jgi:hypothetical protein
MQHMGFPSCCGADVIDLLSGLNSHYQKEERGYEYYRTPEEFRKALDQYVYKHMGITLLITTTEKDKIMKEPLIDFGFIPIIQRFFNDVHNSKLTLWAYIGQPEKLGALKVLKKEQEDILKLIDSKVEKKDAILK